MLITLARTLFLYTLVMVTMRLMGKRQIAQLEPFELVIAIMIAELAVIPMQDRDIPLINGVIAIITPVSYTHLVHGSGWKTGCGP